MKAIAAGPALPAMASSAEAQVAFIAPCNAQLHVLALFSARTAYAIACAFAMGGSKLQMLTSLDGTTS